MVRNLVLARIRGVFAQFMEDIGEFESERRLQQNYLELQEAIKTINDYGKIAEIVQAYMSSYLQKITPFKPS